MKAIVGLLLGAALAGPVAAQDGAPAWDAVSARALVAAIEGAAADGLDPRDYDPAGLNAAIAAGDGVRLQAAATDSYRRLARDLMQGHVGAEQRLAWFIPAPAADVRAIDASMAQAVATRRVAASLELLAPRHPHYRALKAALAATPASDVARIETLRVNLERWRWLPRDPGARHILVNVPSYTLEVSANGRVIARHKVVVGKPKTPTPQFQATASGAILNPWWEIPASIVAESVGGLIARNPEAARAKGYVWTRDEAGHLRARQAPGDGNSLGRMKLVMPNPHSIFVHDTPAKALFARPARAFSHGCIRTEHPLDLTATLTGLSRAEIDAIVAGKETRRVDFAPLPIYVVYLTATADEAGKVTLWPDIYARDDAVAARLSDARDD